VEESVSFQLKFGTDNLNWSEVCQIVEQAPLGRREPDKLRRAAENSYLVCSAYDGSAVIGFGRALSDGEYQSAIYDIVILPEYQGRGVGKAIMEALLAALPPGPVLIYAVPGKEGFYSKLGFSLLLTGMGRFPDLNQARRKGLIS
jgi:aralkylamine N-acetyltransferase